MSSTVTLHARAHAPLPDGSYVAVTISDRGTLGLMVWAGHLAAHAADTLAEDVTLGDYVQHEAVSFMSWHDVLEHFQGRDVEPVVAQLLRTHHKDTP